MPIIRKRTARVVDFIRRKRTARVVDFIHPTWTITTPVRTKHNMIIDVVLSRGARTVGGAFRRAYCQNRHAMDSRPTIRIFSEIRR